MKNEKFTKQLMQSKIDSSGCVYQTVRKAILLFFLYFCFPSLAFCYLYDLAIATVFRNEDRYLKEWIEFHRLVGVEHFYLYSNASQDNYKKVLAPYIDKGIVELIEWDNTVYENGAHFHQFNEIQAHALNDAIRRSKNMVQWLAVIDTDEFLFPVHEFSLKALLLIEYQDVVAIAVHWNSFGTSHVHSLKENELLIEKLVARAPFDHSINRLMKTIFRPNFVIGYQSQPHFPGLLKHFSIVYPDRTLFDGDLLTVESTPQNVSHSVGLIRLNHYWTREEEFFVSRKIKRWGVPQDPASVQHYRTLNDESNQIFDDTIHKYLEPLKLRMALFHEDPPKLCPFDLL